MWATSRTEAVGSEDLRLTAVPLLRGRGLGGADLAFVSRHLLSAWALCSNWWAIQRREILGLGEDVELGLVDVGRSASRTGYVGSGASGWREDATRRFSPTTSSQSPRSCRWAEPYASARKGVILSTLRAATRQKFSCSWLGEHVLIGRD